MTDVFKGQDQDLRFRACSILGLIVSLGCALASGLQAQEVDADKAMKSVGSPDWYDRSEDGYSAPDVTQVDDNSIRTEGYSYKPSAKSTTSTGTGWTWPRWGGGGFNPDIMTGIFTIVIILFVVVLFVLLAYFSVRTYLPARNLGDSNLKKIEIDPTKVEDLPFEISKPTHGNPLDEARALLQAGKYREAIIYLYGYQLLALDQARKIELQRGKTNRMYLRELKGTPRLREIMELTMLIFEDAYFGQHEITHERIMTAWNVLDEFHHLATQATPAGQVRGGVAIA
ncbi:MAG: hypothetical protein AAF483_19200 [Planctomycetota bacterium]